MPSLLYLQEPYRWLYEAMPDPIWAAPERSSTIGSLAALKSAFLDIRKVRNARVQVREEIRNAKSYGRILCNSYFSRESILRAYGVDAQVCYLGIDTGNFRMRTGDRDPFVVAVGSFTREKNPRLCIEALARMRAPRPTLRWVGNFAHDSYLAEMSALAEALDVTLDVKIDIPDEELFASLQSAMAMIYAPRLEPFGLVPIEAGACSTPVVAVAEGGVRETVIDGVNGLLADCDPASLAGALERLRDEPGLAERLGSEGRRLAETKWSLASAAERLVGKLEAEIADFHAAKREPS